MTTPKQAATQAKNQAIYNAYQAMIKSKSPTSKAEFCKLHNTSNRSLNRILDDEYLYSGQPSADKSAKKEKVKPIKKSVKKTSGTTGKASTLKAEKVTKVRLTPEPEVIETEEVSVTEEDKKVVDTTVQEKVSKSLAPDPVPEEKAELISWTVVASGFISILMSDGETITVEKDHPEYADIIHNLAIQDYDQAIISMSLKHKIQAITSGAFVISDTGVTFNGQPVKGSIASDVVELFLREEPFDHLLKFYENLLTTASEQIFNDLWKLISHSGVTLTEDGYVECFKLVNDEYKDKHTGKIDNSIGTTVTMRRTDVDDRRDVTCSTGLHVCAHQYLASCFGTNGRIVKVVIRPQDFVSIPTDYKFTKARTCQYTVVADVTDDYKAGKFN